MQLSIILTVCLIAVRYWGYLYIGKAFSAPLCLPRSTTSLPLVCCYLIRPPRTVFSWVNYSSQRAELSSEHFDSDLSLLKADAIWCENKRCSDSNPWPMYPKVSVLTTTPLRLTGLTYITLRVEEPCIDYQCMWIHLWTLSGSTHYSNTCYLENCYSITQVWVGLELKLGLRCGLGKG